MIDDGIDANNIDTSDDVDDLVLKIVLVMMLVLVHLQHSHS